MEMHSHTFGNKVQPSKQGFHSSMEQNKSTQKKFRTTHCVTSEAFMPPKAIPPTSVQVFSSLMQSLQKESVQSQGWGAFAADDSGDVA